jgi:hypothetical protein
MDCKSCLSNILIVVLALFYTLETQAGTSQPMQVAQTKGEEVGVGQQRGGARFSGSRLCPGVEARPMRRGLLEGHDLYR